MAIKIPMRSKAPVSSTAVRDDPSAVRRAGRQQISAIRAEGEMVQKGIGVFGAIIQDANDSRFRQEKAEFDADYNDLISASIRKQDQSGDLAIWNNAEEITGEDHDKFIATALSNPDITPQMRKYIEFKAPGLKSSNVNFAIIQGNRNIVIEEKRKQPAIIAGFAASGDLKGLREYASQTHEISTPGQIEAMEVQYHRLHTTFALQDVWNEERRIQAMLVSAGKHDKLKQSMDQTKAYAKSVVEDSEMTEEDKLAFLKAVESEENSIRYDTKAAIAARYNFFSVKYWQLKEDRKLTDAQLDKAVERRELRPGNATTLKNNINRTTPLTEEQKKYNVGQASRVMVALRNGDITKEDAEQAIFKLDGLGATGTDMIKEINGYKQSPISGNSNKVISEATKRMDDYIENTTDIIDVSKFTEEEVARINNNIDLAKAQAAILFEEWLNEETKDGAMPNSRKSMEKTVELMRQMRRDVKEKESEEFFKKRPPFPSYAKRPLTPSKFIQEKTKYKEGDIVNRGGKKWKVVGFDEDGTPLVEDAG